MRTSLGEQRYKSELMIVLMHTDLPEPVAPAISRCGIFARLHRIGAPAMSLPSAMPSGEVIRRKLWLSKTLRM